MTSALFGFLALSALAGCVGDVTEASALSSPEPFASTASKPLVQTVQSTHLYMTHYGAFEEPDPGIPDAIYIDAATGAPTSELAVHAPLYQRSFTKTKDSDKLMAPAVTSQFLPYAISPPGFAGLPTPPQVVGAIAGMLGLPSDLVAANTQMRLIAIGQFLGDAPASGTLDDGSFSVKTTVHFQVKLRVVFFFQPPTGVPAPAVGLLVGFVTRGMLAQLVPALPPPADPSTIVSYDWSAPMTLSTSNKYFRPFATEPPPVADPFETDETAVDFKGAKVDAAGRYTIVGSATPTNVKFTAPPELLLVLFHASVLTDVEFAVEESGTLSK